MVRRFIFFFAFAALLILHGFAYPDEGLAGYGAGGLAFIVAHNQPGSALSVKEAKGTDFDVTNEAALFGMLLVRFYQLALSPQTPPACNFTPTCSQFGLLAIKKYGFLLGILMTSDRLQRDNGRSLRRYPKHPVTGKSYDPPERNLP